MADPHPDSQEASSSETAAATAAAAAAATAGSGKDALWFSTSSTLGSSWGPQGPYEGPPSSSFAPCSAAAAAASGPNGPVW
ncbi:hypothetical protein ETH_00040445 [Eimeria tenella]|uniref:Uncharacterized protein n=1 Tax=Eimeria tenella TaxID=5802 RepID=U6KPI2_EIMTE|nr:hypothetical protein ETH_00040445 [Eimeria tenella]CDJ40007.1 hypothetical protein ETH_00040445 [Eimeria tenella]|eukprot:XP_013230760.1 hypothetical protein ETH_00040445 [Eimeria tenella]